MNPKVSVITSVYNGSKFLAQAIDSILGQTFTDFEFIIVNDASDDGTTQILEDYVKRDNRIKIITNPENIGLTKSLNRALGEVRGQYIARMDADDICYVTRFIEQVVFLDNNHNCALVGSWAEIIDDRGKVKKTIKYPTDSLCLKKDLIKYNPFFHSSIMIRKSVLDDVGVYNSDFRFAQDYELYFRIADRYDIANLPRVLISYRELGDSITSKRNRAQITFVIKAKLRALQKGQYSRVNYLYLLKSYISWLIPLGFKRLAKKLF